MIGVLGVAVQGDLGGKKYGSVRATVGTLLREGSWHRLMHGVTWRTINITATVYIATESCIRLPPYIRMISRGRADEV